MMSLRVTAIVPVLALLLAACTTVPVLGDAGHDAGRGDASIDPPDAQTDASVSRERCDEEGEACCRDGRCAGDLQCVDGLCTSFGCGQLDAPCCERDFCSAGLLCQEGTCVLAPCGVVEGAPCCTDGAAPCEGELECTVQGVCGSCGALSEFCCADGTCDPGLECLLLGGDALCLEPPPCGVLGGLCCTDEPRCMDGASCILIDGEERCLFGPPCGAEGGPCCEGDIACGPGLVCAPENACVRCGQLDTFCCDPPFECGPGLVCELDGVCRLPAS